ncbi:aminopeptidase [Halorubrum sp. DTA98]|uniref:aminopeptidase n=1 Tax=Halorubrum sp. DTA98 TaxID=3402163 RepID=UPI003AB0EDC0
MQSVEEMHGASRVVDVCVGVQADETVVVATDWRCSEVGERIAAAAKQRGAEVILTVMTPREHDGNEPPEPVKAAMLEADVVITPVTRSVTHSTVMPEAMERGARFISMVGFTPEQLVTGGLYADYESMRPMCERMAEKFSEASEARVTSPQGTDVTVGLEGRPGNAHPGIATEPGTHTGLVHIESNIAPKEGTTNGTVVFDGAIPNLGIGELDEDVVMEIEDGYVTDVAGGKAAKRIEQVWAEYDVPAVYNIAQLAVGMNPECEEFNDWFSHNHGRYGNVHFGIGTSTNLGGETRAPVHFDAMMAEATLKLDGETVLEGGSEFQV